MLWLWSVLCLVGTTHAIGCPHSMKSTRKLGPRVKEDTDNFMGQIPYATNTDDPLVVANNLFMDIYSATGNTMLPSGHLIICEGDYLVLLKGDGNNYTRIRSTPIVPSIYHDYKMMAHNWFSLFLICLPHTTDAIIHAFPTTQLTAFRAAMLAFNATINATRFPDPGALARQRRIVARSFAFIDDIQNRHNVTSGDVQLYTAHQYDDIMANVQAAAVARLDMLHSVVQDWRKFVLTPAEWDQFRFVMPSSHMASRNDTNVQYFARAMSANPGKPNISPSCSSERFIVVDDLGLNEEESESLLATHIVDYAASNVMFNNTWRMHEDILADATCAYLDKLFPSSE